MLRCNQLLPAPCRRGAAEHVCERWRRLLLALPAACITFDFEEGVWGAEDDGFVPAVLAALGSRAVGHVKVCNADPSLPPQFWRALGEGLVARAHG